MIKIIRNKNFLRSAIGNLYFLIFVVVLFSCGKDKPAKHYPPKKITYLVTGTKFSLNYIDSNSVFQKDRVYSETFRYEFLKSPGASIGISIHAFSTDDQIYSWNIYINDKLYANAFSEGGSYLTVPYD